MSNSPDAIANLLEVDGNRDSDQNSTFADTLGETQTINSTILAHREENGRRYHAYRDGKYLGPNDEQESDRLDILHHIHLLQLDGALHKAPLGKDFSGEVLELGAGTGIWSIDMGDAYPSATVCGVDLSPTPSEWVPPNIFFEIDDVEDDWTFSRKFGYIHSRGMSGAIIDWPRYVGQCFENLLPNGWVEFADWDYSPYRPEGSEDTRDNAVVNWHNVMLNDGCDKTQRDGRPDPKLKKWVADAGFEEVQEFVYETPVGGWSKDKRLKEIGHYYKLSLEEGLEGISLRLLTQVLGMSLEEALVMDAAFRTGMRDIPFYHRFFVVIGRKSGWAH